MILEVYSELKAYDIKSENVRLWYDGCIIIVNATCFNFSITSLLVWHVWWGLSDLQVFQSLAGLRLKKASTSCSILSRRLWPWWTPVWPHVIGEPQLSRYYYDLCGVTVAYKCNLISPHSCCHNLRHLFIRSLWWLTDKCSWYQMYIVFVALQPYYWNKPEVLDIAIINILSTCYFHTALQPVLFSKIWQVMEHHSNTL